jgi:hypothetical protein
MKYVWMATAILLIFCSGPARGESQLLIGVKAGPMFADAKIDDHNWNPPYWPKAGLIAGGSMEWITETTLWRLHPGFRFDAFIVQKGWIDRDRYRPGNEGRLGHERYGTVYIDELVISPLLILRFPKPKVTSYLLIGPEAGFHLSAEEKMRSAYEETRENPFKWRTSPNYGVNIGAGLTSRLGQGFFSAELRYNWGLTNMTEAHSQSLRSIRTNGIQLLLGYSFDITSN